MMSTELKEIIAQAERYEQNLPQPRAGELPYGPEIARLIDHTLLKPEATPEQVRQVCAEARENGFAAVCVNAVYVPLIVKELAGTEVAPCTVVGFPLGAMPTEVKAAEARWAVCQGATEIDMVIPVGLMKGGDYQAVLDDIRAVVDASHAGGALVKVILEMAYLTRREKIIGCLLSKAAGAEFVKTSTGFGPSGAKVEDVALMRGVVGPAMGVKAAGGVRSLADAYAMVSAGASRLGSSSGVKIVQEAGAAERTA